MKPRILCVILWLIWANFSHAYGANIIVEINVSTTVTGSQARVDVDITNKGETQVFNVRAALKGDLFSANFDSLPLLPPGQSHQVHEDIDLPVELVGGNFYAPVVIQYNDREEANISTTALAHFLSAPDAYRPFKLNLQDVTMGKGCRDTEVSVQNMLNTETALSLKLLSAPGITIEPEERVASLSPGQTSILEFELCNALENGNGQYPLYAISSTWLLGRLIQGSANSTVNIETASLPTRFFRLQGLVTVLALLAFVYLCFSWLYAIFKPGIA